MVDSLNHTPCCCSRLAFIQPQLDFFRSEEKPNLLSYLLILKCCIVCSEFRACPVCPVILCECLLVGMDWTCTLRNVLCACPLSLIILRSRVLNDLKINNDNGHVHKIKIFLTLGFQYVIYLFYSYLFFNISLF